MGQALYRKYRSKSFSEIVGQEHITTTLSKAIETGTLAHAYLFTGPRGVGKTSIARILAHEINGLPYTDESMHLDIIEIDAASNRRIDEIRDLRDKVHTAPTSAKYKVYIIDEVHMLTREAFNALLKTLEEPPAHVIFILATTELHKVPDTIVSRTQRFAFKPIDDNQAISHLRAIATAEKVDITDEALTIIANHAKGSFRDSISMLDQLRGSLEPPITEDTVRSLLGIPSYEAADQLVEATTNRDQTAIITQLQIFWDQGFPASEIATQAYEAAKRRLLDKTGDSALLLLVMEGLLSVANAYDPKLQLELCLLRTSLEGTSVIPQAVSSSTIKHTPKRAAVVSAPASITTPAPVKEQTSVTPVQSAPTEQDPVPSEPERAPVVTQPVTAPFDPELWQNVLAEIKKHNNTLVGILRNAHPGFKDDTVVLAFASSFNQKRMSDTKNRSLILDAIHSVSGMAYQLELIVNPDLKVDRDGVPVPPPSSSPSEAPPEELKSVMDVFGGGEVL